VRTFFVSTTYVFRFFNVNFFLTGFNVDAPVINNFNNTDIRALFDRRTGPVREFQLYAVPGDALMD